MQSRASHYHKDEPTRLSQRQTEILKLIAEGRTNAEIGARFGMTLDGAKWHVSEIMFKLGATSREDAVARWRSAHQEGNWLSRAVRAVSSPSAFGLTQVPRMFVLGAAVAAASAVGLAVIAASLSSPFREPAATPALVSQRSVYPQDAADVVAMAITEEEYPRPDALKPLPLQPGRTRDALIIQSVLDMLPQQFGTPLSAADPYIWGTPRLQILLPDGLLTVAVATDCARSSMDRDAPTVCRPVADSVDIRVQRDALADDFERFAHPRLFEWLTVGWKGQFELGNQDEWNNLWDQRLRTPTP